MNGIKKAFLLLSLFCICTSLQAQNREIGIIRPKMTKEVKTVLHTDSSCLDRDYSDFDNYKTYLDSLGMRRLRIIAGWAKTEPQKGVYNLAWLDHVVDECISRGIEPWLLIAYGNPAYEGGGTKFLGGGMPVSDEAIKGWNNYVSTLAEHFRGRVHSWEIWNEPEDFIKPRDMEERIPGRFEIYIDLCERSARILKATDPKCEIAVGALAFFREPFIEDMFSTFKRHGTISLFDYLTVHGYLARPEDVHPMEKTAQRALDKYDSRIKVWTGECGAPSGRASGGALRNLDWTESSQAKWDLRRMVGDHARGLRTGVFTICDINYASDDGIKAKNIKGLLATDDKNSVVKVKQAFRAVRNLMSVIDILDIPSDASSVSIFGDIPSVSRYFFKDRESGRKSLVLWNDYAVPTDDNRLRPTLIDVHKNIFKDPAALDIRTGRVYEIERKGRTSFIVPVYDSPVLITERCLLEF